MFNKKIKTIATVFISCALVYGIAFAQQTCCRDIVSAGKPLSKKIACDYTGDGSRVIFPSHNRNTRPQPKFCRSISSLDFGTGNTCCETDQCSSNNNLSYINFSFFQYSNSLNKGTNALVAGIDLRPTVAPYRPLRSFKASPIYIIKQSIIC